MSEEKTPETSNEAQDAERPSAGSRLWREWIKPFAMVLVVVLSLRSAVADWNDVPSGSMRPTILPGERIFVNKLAYDLRVPFTKLQLAEWDEPHRGDVVVLYSPADGKRLVKRIVGVPGDTLQMRSGWLFVNGQPADYQPLAPGEQTALGLDGEMVESVEQVVWERFGEESHPVTRTVNAFNRARRSFGPVEIPADRYFVMGDNRDNSTDSRRFGFVHREDIVGEALAVVTSLNPKQRYTPRWDRFFLGLP